MYVSGSPIIEVIRSFRIVHFYFERSQMYVGGSPIIEVIRSFLIVHFLL